MQIVTKLLKLLIFCAFSFACYILPGTAADFSTNFNKTPAGKLQSSVFDFGKNVIYCYDPNGNRLSLNDGTASNGIGFTTSSVNIIEAQSSVTIPVVRTGALGSTASVSYSTGNGTATAGVDYTAVSGTLNWAANDECAKFIVVPLLSDNNQEVSDNFYVNLSNASGPPLAGISSLQVNILNDDASGTISIGYGASVQEWAGTASITVSRSGGSDGVVSVNYATSNGTASAGSDYTQTTGTLTWAHGDTANKTITIPILNDAQAEPNENFTVTLSNPNGGATLGTALATVTIANDDCANPMSTQSIAWGTTVSGALSATDGCGRRGLTYYADEYTFTGAVGQVVNILNASSAMDVYVQLIGPDSTVLQSVYGGIGGSGALISKYRLPSAGTYRIQTTSYLSQRTGAYTLQLTELGKPVCTLTATPTTVNPNSYTYLSATCTNQPTSFVWSDTACGSYSTCYRYPLRGMTYSVRGVNEAGTGEAASVYVGIVGQVAQSITIGPSPVVRVGGTGVMSATASSGLPVSFSVTPGNGVCSLAGSTVTGIAQGICTVFADQQGNVAYSPAPQRSASFSILPVLVTVPTPPTITSITAGPGRATINFTPPSNTGGAPIASYTASCAATGQTTKTATGTGSPITVSGLKSGVAYSCSLTASNGTYSSASSAATSVTAKSSDITPILMLLLD